MKAIIFIDNKEVFRSNRISGVRLNKKSDEIKREYNCSRIPEQVLRGYEVFKSDGASDNLNRYKARYRNARTGATRTRVYNEAMLNLSGEQKEVFAKWQAKRIGRDEPLNS